MNQEQSDISRSAQRQNHHESFKATDLPMMPRVLSSHRAASTVLGPGGTAGGKKAEGSEQSKRQPSQDQGGFVTSHGHHFAVMHRSSEPEGNSEILCFNNVFCFLRENQDQKG